MGVTPVESEDLWVQLEKATISLALMSGPTSSQVAEALSDQSGYRLIDVGRVLTADSSDGWKTPGQKLRGARILTHLDVLLWPSIGFDPMRLLTSLARHRSLVAVWPGEIEDGRARYSEPGRPDYYDNLVPPGVTLLRSKAATFPDELPYEVERI